MNIDFIHPNLFNISITLVPNDIIPYFAFTMVMGRFGYFDGAQSKIKALYRAAIMTILLQISLKPVALLIMHATLCPHSYWSDATFVREIVFNIRCFKIIV